MAGTARESLMRQLEALTSRGISVLPLFQCVDGVCNCSRRRRCQAKGKHPRPRNGVKAATTDTKIIRKWLRNPAYIQAANWAAATGRASNLIVVDFDHRSGGANSYAELVDRYPNIEQTVSVNSGNGRHLWFTHPGGVVRNRTSIQPGVDIKADGGYVLIPPSLHPTGVRYEWLQTIEGTDIAPIPPGLMDWVFRPLKSVVQVRSGVIHDHIRLSKEGQVPRGQQDAQKVCEIRPAKIEATPERIRQLKNFVRATVPSVVEGGTRNALACQLGRSIRFSEFAGMPTRELKKAIADHYQLICQRSATSVKATQIQHIGDVEYMMQNAHTPPSGRLQDVVTMFSTIAKQESFPPDVLAAGDALLIDWTDWTCYLLLLCWCFNESSGGGKWFASYQQMQLLIGKAIAEPPHPEQIRRNMRYLEQSRVVKKVQNGTRSATQRRATEWQWTFHNCVETL